MDNRVYRRGHYSGFILSKGYWLGNFQISMSRKGNPYDNTWAESFMRILKYEEIYLAEYETYEDVS